MQKRDERRARASQSDLSDVDGTMEELRDDDDLKAKISVERIPIQEL
jgi:hypothetical protein